MKNIKIFAILILFFSLISISSIQNVKADGYGVGPNFIEIDSALRNMTYRQTVYIYNENNFDVKAQFSIAGEPKDWIKLYEFNAECCTITSLDIPKNSNIPVTCKIEIPIEAANKIYDATIYIDFNSSAYEEISGNYTTVTLSLPIEVSLNVTGDQNYDVTLKLLDIQDVEINSKLLIRTQFENKGNVISKPTIEVTITKDNVYIDKIKANTAPIKPLNINSNIIEWNTTGKAAGRYNAYINIYEGNNKIEQTNITFELLPQGTIKRNGTFEGITYEGDLEKGKIIRIIGKFINEGQIEIEAQFFGEIYKDGNLIGTINSPVIKVAKYKEHHFISYFNIEENGEYLVKGYVLYGGIPTEIKQLKFTVGSILSGNTLILLTSLFLIFLTGITIYYLLKKKKLSFIKKIKWKSPKKHIKFVKKPKELVKPVKKVEINKKAKRKVRIKKRQPTSIRIEDMSAKELEEYVQSL